MTKHILDNIGDLIERLNTRAAIRRTIPTRKSVIEQKPDRISDLLEESAEKIDELAEYIIYIESKYTMKIHELEQELKKQYESKQSQQNN